MAEWKTPKNDYNASSQVTPDIFNTLAENERYLQEKKITTEQVQDAVINSTESTTRSNIDEQEELKVCVGKIRKWFADLKALAFKSTVGTTDINSSAVTSAKLGSSAVTSTKIATNAVTDAKISSVSASKVTGLHNVATSGDYNDLINKPDGESILEKTIITFVVDSDEALAHWVNNDAGFDYTAVLIKAGTWKSSKIISFRTYSGSGSSVGVNLSKTKTKVVIGEPGSKLYFFTTTTQINVWGLAYEYGDFRKATDTDYFMDNVTVHSYGDNRFTSTETDCFVGCCNMHNCIGISENGYEGDAYTLCYNLFNCQANITCTKIATAYNGCHNMMQCCGHTIVTNTDRNIIGGNSKGFYNCTNLYECLGSATSNPVATGAYGFRNCYGVIRCKKYQQSTSDVFANCYYTTEKKDGYECANTVNGGFNDPTN